MLLKIYLFISLAIKEAIWSLEGAKLVCLT